MAARKHAIDDVSELRILLSPMIRMWDGRECVQAMLAGNGQWRQMEWPGFYGEYEAQRLLSKSRFRVGETFGHVQFDFKGNINWDIKVHCEGTSACPLNDVEAVDASIAAHGLHGLIVVRARCLYDEDGLFKAWHDDLKGGQSKYVQEARARGARSRTRKRAAVISSISFITIDASRAAEMNEFQKGMRNADGTPRRAKYLLSATQLHEWSEPD